MDIPGQLRAALDQIRAKIEQAKEEIQTITDAAYPVDEAVSIARAHLVEARTRARYIILGLTRPGERAALSAADVLLGTMPDEELAQRLRSTFGELIEDAGLPIAERPKAIATVQAKISKLLEAEERETLKLETAGYLVDRRAPETKQDVERLLEQWDSDAAA